MAKGGLAWPWGRVITLEVFNPFIAWVPTEEAAQGDAVSSGAASSGDAIVAPSSAMGAGPS